MNFHIFTCGEVGEGELGEVEGEAVDDKAACDDDALGEDVDEAAGVDERAEVDGAAGVEEAAGCPNWQSGAAPRTLTEQLPSTHTISPLLTKGGEDEVKITKRCGLDKTKRSKEKKV